MQGGSNGGSAGQRCGESADAVEEFVIWPHRSLSRSGALLVIGLTGLVFAIVAMRAAMLGAWPQAIYVMLAVGGLAAALVSNARSARVAQVIELAPDTIRVRQLGPAVRRPTIAEFDPMWVRIVEAKGPWDDVQLQMRQSGRSVAIGDFLAPEERVELAAALRRKIADRYANGA